MRVSFQVCGDPAEIRELRLRAAPMVNAAGMEDDRASDVLLMLSELVTNVIRHAGGTGTVDVDVEPGFVVIEVTDSDPSMPTARSHGADALLPGGWGLHFVDQLADDWGVRPHAPTGKTVWFRVGHRP